MLAIPLFSPIFTHDTQLRIGGVLADIPAVVACLRVGHADILGLLHEIEHDVRSNAILPVGFLL